MLLDNSFLRLLEKSELVAKRTQGTHLVGQRRSPRLGGGMEFNDYRQYQRGDDYRYIDWNLYSRLEQLFLKQFVEERDYLVYFLVDHSRSMGYGQPTKLHYAAQLAAALGYIALIKSDRVGSVAFSSCLDAVMRPVKSKNRARSYFDFLAQLEPAGETNVNQALTLFGHKYKQPGLAVVLSDFLDPLGYQQGILALRSAGWQVWLVQILSEQEVAPTPGADLYLIDSETSQAKEVYLSEAAVNAYRQNVEAHCQALARFSKEYGNLYLRITTTDPLEHILFQRLRKERGLK